MQAQPPPRLQHSRPVNRLDFLGNEALVGRFPDVFVEVPGEALANEVDPLKPRDKRSVVSYMDAFYKRISTPKEINKRFVEKCLESA